MSYCNVTIRAVGRNTERRRTVKVRIHGGSWEWIGTVAYDL